MVFEDVGESGSVVVLRPGNVSLLRPAEQLVDDMLAGWAGQQSSRLLASRTIHRREAQMHDFTRNPKAIEFGRYGVCNVRWGKATRGSQPRRRAVLTVFDWTRPVLEEYITDVLPRFELADAAVLWPTERQGRIRLAHIDDRFADWRDELGLDPVLHPHCVRHSYVTHLIEDGFDPLFVQQQVGHRWGSTTALYTGVSGDYRNRVLRHALDEAFTSPPDEGSEQP